MKTIATILKTFSGEEKQEFLALMNRKNRRTDTKNGKLFKLIEAGKTENLDIALYGKPAKNSYHALCKRLQDNLIDFVASKSFAGETSEELDALKLLLASRIFFEKSKHKIAFKTLEKAEKVAKQTDLYSILNEIYHTKIQYAHLNSKIILADCIQVSEENMKLYQQDFQLNRAYAVIKSEFKKGTSKSVNETIHDVFLKFHIKVNTALTYKSLFQLMEITTTAAKLQSDYYTISSFMMEIYAIINTKRNLLEKHRYYHISILNLLAITNFRNKKFDISKDFTNKMELEMKKNNGEYYKRFLEKLTIITALNYNYTGDAEIAISMFNKFKGDSLNISLLVIMCFFQQSDFTEAYHNLKKLNHSDIWYEKKMGWIWVLKKNILEILLLIEIDKLDLVLTRLQSFKRKFSKRLSQTGELRVLTFIQLVSKYYENPKQVVSKAFKNEVEESFDWLGKEQEDIFVMSFYAWLKAKMQNENLYAITLQLVKATTT